MRRPAVLPRRKSIRYNYFPTEVGPGSLPVWHSDSTSAQNLLPGRILNLRQPMEPRSAERPDPDARGLLVSFSPQAGPRSSEQRARGIVAELESAGYRVAATSDLAELGELAAVWHETGQLRCVLACGGDGTAAIVLNHAPLAVPMLLVPMGTENLLGQYVSQSASPAAVREAVDGGVSIGLDLGHCRNDQA